MKAFGVCWMTLALACTLTAAPPAKSAAPKAAKAPADKTAEKTAEPDKPKDPDALLDQEVSDSGGGMLEIAAVLERHLKSHADCPKRKEIVRVLAQVGVEGKDRNRLLLYGPQAIDAGYNDSKLLEQVSRALLERNDPQSLAQSLTYSTKLVAQLREQRKSLLASTTYTPGQGRHLDEVEFALRGALVYRARALTDLGKADEALESANEAWSLFPNSDTAMERVRVLESKAAFGEALDAAAEAFIVEDSKATAKERQKARERVAELGAKAGVSEPSSRVLAAWDRTHLLLAERAKRVAAFDSNVAATNPLEFTLSKLDGGRLALNTLKGKVVVLDFWATWCGPCRVQHPLYEQVKTRFKSNPDVVFLAVSTDEDRSLVKPFIDAQRWSKDVLFEDGLGGFFRVNSIPTTIVLNRAGEVASRMPGFIPERFVDMLADRIQTALDQF